MPETATIDPPAVESTPESQKAALTAVQEAFERAVPLKGKKAEAKQPEPAKTVEPSKPAEAKPVEAKPAEAKTPEQELKLPSFITGEPKETKPAEPEIKLEDLPKEPPKDAPQDVKDNFIRMRKKLDAQDAELSTLRQKQADKQDAGKELSPADTNRLQQLESELGQAREQLQRYGLQNHPQFVQQILQPLQASYFEAKRIIKDAGGNPEALDKAVALTGKSHYDAMDAILEELPESAKGELTSTMRDFRKLSQARVQAIANAPKALEEIQKQEALSQRNYLETQKGEMESLFEQRYKHLRDNLKLETLIETNEEDAKWWNEIPKKVKTIARQIALENQDMETVMDASILGASAMTFRDLWLKAEKARAAAEKDLSALKGSEPRISDAGSEPTEKVDPNEPLEKMFLRKLKEVSGKG